MFEWRFWMTPGVVPQPFLDNAYLAGWGRIPSITQNRIFDNEIVVRAEILTSGSFHVPMFHSPLGVIMESTESLLGRSEPYLLVRELARGSLGKFYRRLFDWQMLGFQQPPDLEDRVRQIAKRFASLIVQQPFSLEIEREYVVVLDELALLIVDENREIAEQSLSWKLRNDERLPVVLGIGMNNQRIESLHEFAAYAQLLRNSFHVVLPMLTWRELEPQPDHFAWERLENLLLPPSRFGFSVVFGPLLSFSPETFPEWVLPHLDKDGFFESRASRFVNTLTERYSYLAHSWILANRFVDQTIPAIPPKRSIALIRILAQQMRSRGISSPIIVGINQPWGEYALQRVPDWEQVQIAEALMGCRDIDTFLLEMDFGYGESLTLPRDPMCIGNMIDQWSFLGKRVYVSFSFPSAGNPVAAEVDFPSEFQWSEERQRLWTEMLLLTLLSKRSVRGIFWSCLQDPVTPYQSTSTVNYGLVNEHRVVKPAFTHFPTTKTHLLW